MRKMKLKQKVKMIKVGNKNIPPFFKGEVIKNIECIDISNMGFGVVKPKNFTVFVKGLIIGEIADIKIEKVSKNFAIGKLLNINKESKDRVIPPCPYAKDCNGCKYQHISYNGQISLKEKQLADVFGYKVKLESADDQFYYRNKSGFTVSNGQLNMHGDNNKLVPVDQCLISHKEINKLMPFALEAINNNKKANIKEIVFRYSDFQDAMMIILVSDQENFYATKIAQEIVGYSNKVKSVILNVGKSNNYLFNEDEKTIYGEDYLIDKLFNKLFKITSKSFYQVNHAQTQKLYQSVIDFGQFHKEDNILDLYCGIGTIGIILSDYVNHVYGVELLEDAVDSAKQNLELNEVSNVEIVSKDLNDDFLIEENIDCIIVDPPRSGLSKKIIENINKSNVDKLIYVSCNPVTQKRDIEIFNEVGFKVIKHKAVDMFINTEHIESIIKLSR